MKKLYSICLALVILLTGSIAAVISLANEEPPRLGARTYMRVKLTSSQKVLEGLVTSDFSLIEKGAQEMKEMSEASDWPRAKDELYEHYGVEFRRLCGKLSQLAKDKNLEGASFAYVQMMASCITCHDRVRSSLKPARDPRSPFQLIPTVPTQP